MKFIDEFRDKKKVSKLVDVIRKKAKKIKKNLAFMEVCGTHTVAIFRYGIRKVLPKNIRVISGPGCPVCVTAQRDIDKAVAFSRQRETIITTFGDMLKVPGTESSLQEEKAKGRDIRVVYSVLDSLSIARLNKNKRVVHIAIGFETTAPTVAAAIIRAEAEKLNNFYILSAHKIIPPALAKLVASGKSRISGFLLPGHVSTIIGSAPYKFLAEKFKTPCVIAGFEVIDILQAIGMLLDQIENNSPEVQIQYTRCVHSRGNITAQKMMNKIYQVYNASWRGLGMIKKSGLRLKKKYAGFDASKQFHIKLPEEKKTNCRCGDVLQGIITPRECPLFRRKCTPRLPIGPCMVSSEGACAAYYRYGGDTGG